MAVEEPCRYCEQAHETLFHIFIECGAIEDHRRKTIGRIANYENSDRARFEAILRRPATNLHRITKEAKIIEFLQLIRFNP